MSCNLPNGHKRPILDVDSPFLIYIWNVPDRLAIGEIKMVCQRFGRVKFVETFEAWQKRKIGQIIIEYSDQKGLDDFVDALSRKTVFVYNPPIEFRIYSRKDGQKDFFDYVKHWSGVDLLTTQGIPPSFDYNNTKTRPTGRVTSNAVAVFQSNRDNVRPITSNSNNTDNHLSRRSFNPNAPPFRPSSVADSTNGPNNSTNNRGGFGQRGGFRNGGSFTSNQQSENESETKGAFNGSNGRGGFGFGRGREGSGPRVTFGTPREQNDGKSQDKENNKEEGKNESKSTAAIGGGFGRGGWGNRGFEREQEEQPVNGHEKINNGGSQSRSHTPPTPTTVIMSSYQEQMDKLTKNWDSNSLHDHEIDEDFRKSHNSNKASEINDGFDDAIQEKTAPASEADTETTQFQSYREKCFSTDTLEEENGSGKPRTIVLRNLKLGFSVEKILEIMQDYGDVMEYGESNDLARFVFLEPADANNAKMGICDEAQLLGPNAKVELVYE